MVYDFLIHYVLYVYQLCIGGLATGWEGNGITRDERKVMESMAVNGRGLRFVCRKNNGLIVRKDWVTGEGNRYYIRKTEHAVRMSGLESTVCQLVRSTSK